MSDIMTLRSGGNVGIGTTCPSYKLDVGGDIRSTGGNLRLEGVFPRIYLTDTDNNSDYSIFNGNGTLRIYDDTNSADRFALASAGNVGIGTTSPSNTLDVNGGAEINGETYIRSTSNVGLRIQTTDQGIGGNDGLRVGLNGTHAFVWQYENKPLSFATNGGQRMTISAGGNVGIGTTSPSNTLDVNGSADISGRLDVASDLRIRGNSGDIDQGVVRQYVNSSNTLFIDAGNDGNNVGQFKSDGSLILNSSSSQGLSIRQSANSGNDMQVEIRGSRNAPAAGVNPAKLILSSYDNDDGSGVVKTGAEFYMESTSLTGGDLSDFEVGLRYRKDGAVVDGISIHDGR